MNLISYQKAGEILGYSKNSGSVYELLSPLDSHIVNGVKHWNREDVEKLRDKRLAEGKARRQRNGSDHANDDHLKRIEAKIDRLIAMWEGTK